MIVDKLNSLSDICTNRATLNNFKCHISGKLEPETLDLKILHLFVSSITFFKRDSILMILSLLSLSSICTQIWD